MEENNGSKGLAIASLVLGILSLCSCCSCFPLAIIGLIISIVVLVQKKNGKGLAIAGLITSAVALVVFIVSAVRFAPYASDYMDFVQNSAEYVQEYEEDGTYPPLFEKLIDEGKVPEDQVEQIFNQIVSQMEGAVGTAED